MRRDTRTWAASRHVAITTAHEPCVRSSWSISNIQFLICILFWLKYYAITFHRHDKKTWYVKTSSFCVFFLISVSSTLPGSLVPVMGGAGGVFDIFPGIPSGRWCNFPNKQRGSVERTARVAFFLQLVKERKNGIKLLSKWCCFAKCSTMF